MINNFIPSKSEIDELIILLVDGKEVLDFSPKLSSEISNSVTYLEQLVVS